MAKYKCEICGYIFDEGKEDKSFSTLEKCPICGVGSEHFVLVEEEFIEDKKEDTKSADIDIPMIDASTTNSSMTDKLDLSYDKATYREDASYRHMNMIHEIAVSGKSLDAAMATKLPMPSWDNILILGAQLDRLPLDDGEEVVTQTIIGKNAKKPMVLENPVYISHMSFGSLSKEAKVSLSRGTAMSGSAMCSGEGGILEEEMKAADKYIFEYVPNKYSVTDENLKNSDAIEIKIGQGTKPGMGGHLPGEKVTEEIARVRGKKQGEDVQSPSRIPGIDSKEDLKELVTELRERSEGRPIGIKIAAGRIEEDLAVCVFAGPDFITIDGRGGATGSSPFFLREATSVPTIYALSRARKYLDSVGSDIQLVITGGLRISADFAKAIAMGADAIAVATAGLIALGCQQYRICGSDKCPVGIATQQIELRERLDEEKGAQRVSNYLNVSLEELRVFARVTGHKNLHDLSLDDLCTIDKEISEFTDIRHA